MILFLAAVIALALLVTAAKVTGRRILRRAAWLAAAVVAVLVSHAVYPIINLSRSFSGHLVDAETGKPIEGAVVLATWFIDPTLTEGGHFAAIAVEEAVTDVEGRYVVAGWGPRFNFGMGRVMEDSLEVWYLARGYAPVREIGRPFQTDSSLGYPLKLSRDVPRGLQRANGQMYANDMVAAAYGSGRNPGCDWAVTPKTTQLMTQIGADLAAQHILFPACARP